MKIIQKLERSDAAQGRSESRPGLAAATHTKETAEYPFAPATAVERAASQGRSKSHTPTSVPPYQRPHFHVSRNTQHATRNTQHATRNTQHATRIHISTYPRINALAFSLIEILITVGLLSFIILGLLLMFNQVQRAFRSSMTQTDVLESGRAVTDSLARELAEMTPCQLSYTNINFPTLNFMAQLADEFTNCVLQDLPGTSDMAGLNTGPYHTNLVQRFFFMSKSNQTYVGIGYRVIPDYIDPNQCGLGTLYRFSANTNKYFASGLANRFFADSQSPTNPSMHRIADGVVHLRLQAFDTNGAPMFYTNNYLTFWGTNLNYRTPLPWVSLTNTFGAPDFGLSTKYRFYSNAVPAYVELEIGFLEPHLLERYRALAEANVPAARSYLASHTANIHLFRQRIPIRSVDYSAYQ